MKNAGYATGHFGKWHLNGLRGPGVPILRGDKNGPGAFGFDTWLSVTNFFDLNPIMSRNGKFEEFSGDSSEVIVNEAVQFMDKQVANEKPFFCVIWYGTPHSPWMALKKDMKEFTELNENSQSHYAELRAMDRSIGTLRSRLRDMNIEKDTLVWFTSDNGGLPKINPSSTGGLRDFKGSMYEGGIRVPAIIEWPKRINKARISSYPAGAVDIFPTIADIARLPDSSMIKPVDGLSLVPLIKDEIKTRNKPLLFSSRGRMAVIDNDWKMISQPKQQGRLIELFNLSKDQNESNNLFRPQHPKVTQLRKVLVDARISIGKSVQGKDYPEEKVFPQPPRIFWTDIPEYQKYFPEWKSRPEYESRLKKL
jgi:arylsulfatase A-like enzyme